MTLDIYTLLVTLCMSAILQLAVMAWQWRLNPSVAALRLWVIQMLYTMLGIFALYLRIIIGMDFFTVIAANALMLLGEIYRYKGIVVFLHRKEKTWISLVIFPAYFLVYYYFAYVLEQQAIRITVTSILTALLLLLSTIELKRAYQPSKKLSTHHLAMILGVAVCYHLMRGANAAILGVNDSFFHPSITQVNYLTYQLIIGYLWTFGVFIVTDQSANLARTLAEAKFRLLFNTNPDIAFTTNAETGIIEEVNDTFVLLSGYSREETLHHTIQELEIWATPEDRVKFMNKIAQDGYCNNLELGARKKDGNIIQMLLSTRIIHQGSDSFLINVARDITELKRIEEKVRVLSQAVEQSASSIVLTDIDGHITYVNQKFIDLTGYSMEEAYWQNPRILKSGLQPESLYRELWETVLSGKDWRGEFYNVKKNGDFYWESASISPIFNDQNQLVSLLAVKEDITDRKQLEEELRHQARTDVLTGLANRRHFISELELELLRNARYPKEHAFMILDIDLFKNVNDEYGHLIGDQTLKLVAQTCRDTIRSLDLIGRIGGEEFAIFLLEVDLAFALEIAERLRKNIEQMELFDDNATALSITISLGVTVYRRSDTVQSLMSRADQALYRAKRNGRNRVEVEVGLMIA